MVGKSSLRLALSLLAFGQSSAFIASPSRSNVSPTSSSAQALSSSSQNDDNDNNIMSSRRNVVSLITSSLVTATVGSSLLFPEVAYAEAETMERGGVQLTPFNSLAFNYRGGDSPTVDASTLNEPSVTYAEFLEKLNANQVTFVEFLAPNGDAAYATFKSENNNSKPIRIGEGYPIEDPEGWSSPAFVIKAVAKAGVPYKFVVPGLSASFHN